MFMLEKTELQSQVDRKIGKIPLHSYLYFYKNHANNSRPQRQVDPVFTIRLIFSIFFVKVLTDPCRSFQCPLPDVQTWTSTGFSLVTFPILTPVPLDLHFERKKNLRQLCLLRMVECKIA